MRLGFLGPALGHEGELSVAARGMRDKLGVDRVVYLGSDRALDAVVSQWAVSLVGGKASDESLFERATRTCLHGSPEAIDAFIAREHERSSLRMFESLAGETTRSVELIAGKVAVMLYDKALLEEDDILPASLLLFGKSQKPLLRQVGRRWFLSPGTFPEHGLLVIEEEADDLYATVFAPDFSVVLRQHLESPKALRMRARGAS